MAPSLFCTLVGSAINGNGVVVAGVLFLLNLGVPLSGGGGLCGSTAQGPPRGPSTHRVPIKLV